MGQGDGGEGKCNDRGWPGEREDEQKSPPQPCGSQILGCNNRNGFEGDGRLWLAMGGRNRLLKQGDTTSDAMRQALRAGVHTPFMNAGISEYSYSDNANNFGAQ